MLVYKYRGGDKNIFKRDLDSLEKCYFWAPDSESLNDPCETLINVDSFKNQIGWFIKIFYSKNQDVKERFKNVSEALNDLVNFNIGIFSLSKTFKDELLWAHYANSHKGFCIEYDLDILMNNYSSKRFSSYPVKYYKNLPKVTLWDMISLSNNLNKNRIVKKFSSTKSKKWINEQEIRIITDNFGKHHYYFKAVKSIYFGLKMLESEKDKLMSALKGRGIRYFQMQLSDNSYKFYAAPIQDNYRDCKPYIHKITTVSKVAIDKETVQKGYRKFIPYLYKAIEIARHNLYCKHVEYAEFCSTNSKLDDPIIFVNCEMTNGESVNFYYSLSEIENIFLSLNKNNNCNQHAVL